MPDPHDPVKTGNMPGPGPDPAKKAKPPAKPQAKKGNSKPGGKGRQA